MPDCMWPEPLHLNDHMLEHRMAIGMIVTAAGVMTMMKTGGTEKKKRVVTRGAGRETVTRTKVEEDGGLTEMAKIVSEGMKRGDIAPRLIHFRHFTGSVCKTKGPHISPGLLVKLKDLTFHWVCL